MARSPESPQPEPPRALNGHGGNGNGNRRTPTTRQPNIVMTRNVQKDFRLGDQWIHALRGVNVEIPRGQFIAIMGPSGSGKSTLLYLLGGLDRPNDGEIWVAGRRLDGMSSQALAQFRRETVGFIFQAFHLVPTLTALENVGLPGVFSAMPQEERELRATKLLKALGMGERLDHRPNQLSGGQQQRVAIARSLFNNPPIIMADEPTGALDSKTGQTVLEMLRYLCSKRGKTIIIVTHDPVVASYADRMLHLRDGEIVSDTLTQPSLRQPIERTALPEAAQTTNTLPSPSSSTHDTAEAFSSLDDEFDEDFRT